MTQFRSPTYATLITYVGGVVHLLFKLEVFLSTDFPQQLKQNNATV